MGCRCNEQTARTTEPEGPMAAGPCEVCGYDRGDWTTKIVRYCRLCDAWICDRCWHDWPARARAALKRKMARLQHARSSV